MTALHRWRTQLMEFLFFPETDTWLTILRLGLGLQVTLYSLSLRNDWSYLLAETSGLVNRNLAEGLLSVESRFVPRLRLIFEPVKLKGAQENAPKRE